MISEYLDTRSLSFLSLTCTHLHQVLSVRLYQTLNIRYGERGADAASMKLMRTFQESPTCRQLLRNIEIASLSHQQWVWEPLFRPLCLALTGIIQILPQNTLDSFTWKLASSTRPDIIFHVPRCISKLHLETTSIDHSALFPHLKELSCNRISTAEDIAWISWHIRSQNLRKLCLGLSSIDLYSARVFESLVYPIPSLATLTSLRLERMEVWQWPFQVMDSLKSLNLHHCVHVDVALSSIIRCGNRQLSLRELTISMVDEPLSLVAFLSALSKRAQLETLRICTAGGQNRLPSSCVLMFQDSIRHLELESRSIATNLRTVYLYSIENIAQITTNCRLLKTLSIPMDIGIDDRRLWVSMREDT